MYVYTYIHFDVCVYIYMYGMVWYGMVWYGMVWYGMVWYGMVWYGMVCMYIYIHTCKRVIKQYSCMLLIFQR